MSKYVPIFNADVCVSMEERKMKFYVLHKKKA